MGEHAGKDGSQMGKDRLDDIWEKQAALNDEIAHLRHLEFTPPAEWAPRISVALIAELIEVLDELNYKWWKNAKPVERQALAEELADVLHFFVSLCLIVDVSPDELYQAYVSKQRENLARQHGESAKVGYSVADRDIDGGDPA